MSESKEQAGEVFGMPVYLDPTMKSGEWRLEYSKDGKRQIVSNTPEESKK